MFCGESQEWNHLWLVLVITLAPLGIAAQDLDAKLAQKPDFIPAPGNAREQLIQVAQHYKLPMGIEWVLQPEESQIKLVEGEATTVMALLQSILQVKPEYSVSVRNGVVNVSCRGFAVDSRNFLNLRIDEFSLTSANVFDADAELRLKIRATLHPERFVGGTNGGYGYGVPHENGLDVPNISFSARNITVRDILDRIVSTNGNTLWLVNIAPSKMMKNEPFFAQFDANQETDLSWTIIPFNKSVRE